MRVLQVTLHEGVGGMESVVQELTDGLSARGLTVAVHALDRGAQHAGERSRTAFRVRDLVRRVRRFRPDIVLSHSAIPTAYVRLLPFRTNQVAVVHSPGQDLLERKLKWAERLTGRRTAATVFVSKDAMTLYEAHFPDLGGELQWIPNGVRLPSVRQSRRTWPPRNLVAVSRLTPSKDLETAISGFSRYAQVVEESRLRIVGDAADPTYLEHLKGIVDSSPLLEGRVQFLGRRSDVTEILASSDLLIHASHYEAQGLVLAEAAVAGLPAITTEDVGRVVWWAMARREFPVGDAEALGLVLERVAQDFSVLDAARRAVPLAQEQLRSEVMVDRYAALLRRVGGM